MGMRTLVPQAKLAHVAATTAMILAVLWPCSAILTPEVALRRSACIFSGCPGEHQSLLLYLWTVTLEIRIMYADGVSDYAGT